MRRWFKAGAVVGAAAAVVLCADFIAAHTLLWRGYDTVRAGLAAGVVPEAERIELSIEKRKQDSAKWKPSMRAVWGGQPAGKRLRLDIGERTLWLSTGATNVLAAPPKARFEAGACDFSQTRTAVSEAAASLPRLTALQRLAASLRALPLVTAFDRDGGGIRWRISSLAGEAIVFSDGFPRRFRFELPSGDALLRARFECGGAIADTAWTAPDAPAVPVRAAELDGAIAAAVELLSLQWRPVSRPADGVWREGAGVLEVRDGLRRLLLRGTPHEIGFQHGRLLKGNVSRLVRRMVFGVGLYYSVEKGVWFPDEARKLVERQRPFIGPAYFEELDGLAEGAGLPADLVACANIFPEFFHCSGVAIRGKATAGGELLHARVLDYMTDAGLQDEAVVMAVARNGARRFVNVSYAGFIGSVTGMNDAKVAIGEMGGRGEGLWDGTPMSLLLRGALENADTAAGAIEYMRGHPRTCEYYYVVSDGKDRSCAGIKATPELFEVIQPGASHPQLADPIEDTVLFSADDRYRELVKRVRAAYGRIDEDELIRILDRPVSMRSNLHNVIFAPERLALRIAHATRHEPACRTAYHAWTWEELFAEPAPQGR